MSRQNDRHSVVSEEQIDIPKEDSFHQQANKKDERR